MIKWKSVKIMILIVIMLGLESSFAQKKFDVYGFMDFKYRKRFMEENNFFQSMPELLSPESQMFIGNLNTYFDFNPNEYTRALIEINLNASTYDKSRVAGWDAMLSGAGENLVLGQVYQGAYVQAFNAFSAFLDSATSAYMADSIANLEVQANGATYVAGANKALQDNIKSPYEGNTKYGGILLERAWFDITPTNFFNIRVGRFLTPAGIWNVDHGSPLIVTIGQPNETSLVPIFPKAQTGVMGYGSIYLGDHDLTYKAYVSTGRDDNNTIGHLPLDDITEMGVGLNLKFNADILDEFKIGASLYTGVDESKELIATAKIDDPSEPIVDKFEFEWVEGDRAREIDFGFDFKGTVKGITLQTECNFQRSKNLKGSDLMTPVNAFYTLLSYDWFIHKNAGLTPYFFFERISWEDPQESPRAGLNGFPFLGWNQITGGLNLRIFSNVHLKVEYNFANLEPLNEPKNFDGSLNVGLWNDYGEDDLNIKTIATELSIAF